MAASFSDPDARRQAGSSRPDADDAVSEVIGFLLTFAIISSILLVAMLGFNNAQQRAEVRLIEIQGNSAAQRVAAAAVDLALYANDYPYETSVAIDLPLELQGISYSVQLCGTGTQCSDTVDPNNARCALLSPADLPCDWCDLNPCPYVKVESFRGEPQRQSTFLLAGKEFCTTDNVAGGGIVYLTYFPDNAANTEPEDCIGLIDET